VTSVFAKSYYPQYVVLLDWQCLWNRVIGCTLWNTAIL